MPILMLYMFLLSCFIKMAPWPAACASSYLLSAFLASMILASMTLSSPIEIRSLETTVSSIFGNLYTTSMAYPFWSSASVATNGLTNSCFILISATDSLMVTSVLTDVKGRTNYCPSFSRISMSLKIDGGGLGITRLV